MNKIPRHSARMVAVALLALGIMSIHSPAWGAKGGGGPMACAEGEGAYFDSSTHTWECDVFVVVMPSKYVFLSSTKTFGNMGGQAGADLICNGLASDAGLQGSEDSNFLAWISGELGTPSSRFAPNPGPYVLPLLYDVALDTVKTIVAYHWEDLTNGSLNHDIDVTEEGEKIHGGDREENVWTGIWIKLDDPGMQVDSNCLNWTSKEWGYTGLSGNIDKVGNDWSSDVLVRCGDVGNTTIYQGYELRLYCFEQ